MAKLRERISAGKSIDDLMNMPISKLQDYSLKQQREIVSRLGSAANKRLKKLEASGIENSATIRIDKSGGKISVRGKDTDELIKEYIRARDFLKNKFSSKKEWNKVIDNIMKKADKEFTENHSRDVIGKAFSYYDILRDMDSNIVNKINKYVLRDYIADIIETGGSREEIINKSLNYINENIKKNWEEYEGSNTRFGDKVDYDIPMRMKRKRKRHKK